MRVVNSSPPRPPNMAGVQGAAAAAVVAVMVETLMRTLVAMGTAAVAPTLMVRLVAALRRREAAKQRQAAFAVVVALELTAPVYRGLLWNE